MSEKILVPVLGESVTEATVSKWLKNQGEVVASEEPLVELETDKVNIEVPSPSNGTLETISVQEGQTVNVGALLGTIGESKNKNKNETKTKEETYTPPPKKIKPQTEKIKNKEIPPLILEDQSENSLAAQEETPLILDQVHEEKKAPTASKIVSPSARKLAAESNINTENIKGSGKNGVVLKEDVMSLMGSKPKPSERKIAHGPEERIKMTRLRLTIAKRLKEAQENAAMLTTFNEVDMHEVIKMKNN